MVLTAFNEGSIIATQLKIKFNEIKGNSCRWLHLLLGEQPSLTHPPPWKRQPGFRSRADVMQNGFIFSLFSSYALPFLLAGDPRSKGFPGLLRSLALGHPWEAVKKKSRWQPQDGARESLRGFDLCLDLLTQPRSYLCFASLAPSVCSVGAKWTGFWKRRNGPRAWPFGERGC